MCLICACLVLIKTYMFYKCCFMLFVFRFLKQPQHWLPARQYAWFSPPASLLLAGRYRQPIRPQQPARLYWFSDFQPDSTTQKDFQPKNRLTA